MIAFTGTDTDFMAIWDCQKQSYTVYYKGKLMTVEYRFRDIKTYLN